MKKNKNGKWIQTHIGYQIGILTMYNQDVSIDLAWVA
jgi:hypothetical protein